MASNKKIVTMMLIALVGLAFAGCSDNDNDVVPAPTIDTAPPTLAGNLTMAYSDGAATISWNQNVVDADLAGYVVLREQNDVSTELVGTPTMIHSYTDSNPLYGSSMYHVYAVDTSGNQSAVATVYLTLSPIRSKDELAE